MSLPINAANPAAAPRTGRPWVRPAIRKLNADRAENAPTPNMGDGTFSMGS